MLGGGGVGVGRGAAHSFQESDVALVPVRVHARVDEDHQVVEQPRVTLAGAAQEVGERHGGFG